MLYYMFYFQNLIMSKVHKEDHISITRSEIEWDTRYCRINISQLEIDQYPSKTVSKRACM